VHGAGWGWLGGGVAREKEWARLGTKRDTERGMLALVWSGGQREGVELEVARLGFCQGKGEGRERVPQRLTCGVGWPTGSRYPHG
jgi:hypothetical protein